MTTEEIVDLALKSLENHEKSGIAGLENKFNEEVHLIITKIPRRLSVLDLTLIVGCLTGIHTMLELAESEDSAKEG